MTKLTKAAIGALGGAVGAFLMGEVGKTKAEESGARPPRGEDPTEKVANVVAMQFTGRKLRYSKRKPGGQLVHYAFGAAMGALYALIADSMPVVTAGGGALFGAAVYAGAHALVVPALGLASGPLKNGADWENAEFSAHVAYGTTTETVRRLLSR